MGLIIEKNYNTNFHYKTNIVFYLEGGIILSLKYIFHAPSSIVEIYLNATNNIVLIHVREQMIHNFFKLAPLL